MKVIHLTKGYETIVDDEDYDFLMQWKWHVHIGNYIYAIRRPRVDGKRDLIFMHRVVNGTPAGMVTDHIDGNTLDNRRGNLRIATSTQNAQNRKPYKNGTSQHKGVWLDKQSGKWRAAIRIHKRLHHIGLFHNEEDAASAYAERAAFEFGEFYRQSGGVIA